MRPQARVQAAIELLDQIIGACREGGGSADRIVAAYFKTRRYAGSKDRRAVRELVYQAIRACGPLPWSGRTAMLRLAQDDPELLAMFDGSPHGPTKVGANEAVAEGGVAQQWLAERLVAAGASGNKALSLLERAPLDVRVNALKASRDAIELPQPGEPLAAPGGLRFESGTPVDQWDAWTHGAIEVQDHGSQLACMAIGAKAGDAVLDLCAGAGGKTLALAAAMQGKGTIIASDTDKRRLGNLMPRASRAGADPIIETVLLDPGKELEALGDWRGKLDHVVIDAPCPSTGTWRRNPETRWRLTPKRLQILTQTQERLIDIGMEMVKPGGRVTYVTCSLLDEEGRDQIEAALVRHPGAEVTEIALPLGRARGKGYRLTPWLDQTDGFFIAQLSLPC